jgi:hypothetical protein
MIRILDPKAKSGDVKGAPDAKLAALMSSVLSKYKKADGPVPAVTKVSEPAG